MKLHTIFYTLIYSLAFAACQSEDIQLDEGHGTLEFYTSTRTETRTSLENGTQVVWNTGDKIAVYDMGITAKHEFTAEIKDGNTHFKGYITPKQPAFIAVYPFNQAGNDRDGNNITVSLPATQTAVQDGFGPGLNLSIAKGVRNLDGTPSRVTFRNLCQLLKLTIPAYAADRIAKIEFEATSGIAGDLTVNYENDDPTATLNESGAGTTITLMPPTGTTAFAAGTYYIVAAPITIEGFTLRLTDTAGKAYTQHSSATITAAMGIIRNLGTVDLIETPTVTATHVYEDGVLKGTNLTLTAPQPDTDWSATVKNAEGTTVRTLAEDDGERTSAYINNAVWPYLPTGNYTVEYTYKTANNKDMNGSTTFTITEKPRFTVTMQAASTYSYYLGEDVTKDVAKANGMAWNTVSDIACVINGIDPAILTNPKYSYSVTNDFDGAIISQTGAQTSFDNIQRTTLGENTLSATVTFDGATASDDKTVWITGLPFDHNPPRFSDWSRTGGTIEENDDHIRLGRATDGDKIIRFNGIDIPANTKMILNYRYYYKYSNIFTSNKQDFSISGNDELWFKNSHGTGSDEITSQTTVTNGSATTQISCVNDYALGDDHIKLYRIALKYAE